MTETFNIGDFHRCTVQFFDLANDIEDPSEVRFTLREPDGSITNYLYGTDAELVRNSQGQYHADVTYQQKGRHIVKWVGTGEVELVEQLETYVVETI